MQSGKFMIQGNHQRNIPVLQIKLERTLKQLLTYSIFL